MELSQKAANLPTDAGVYLFKDALGNILYVGKSRSLRNRVKSYFLESRWLDAKTGSLVREIRDLRGPLGLPIERDLHFDADKPLSAYADEARTHGRIVT